MVLAAVQESDIYRSNSDRARFRYILAEWYRKKRSMPSNCNKIIEQQRFFGCVIVEL